MNSRDIAGLVLLVLLVAGVAIVRHRSPPVAKEEAVPVVQSSGSLFDSFCARAQLVPKAYDDCKSMMAAAKTDEDRLKVERMFAMGAVKVDALPQP